MTTAQWLDRTRELQDISNQFLDRTPHGRTMRYFVGRFDPDRLYRRRVFIAAADGGVGRVEEFIVCTPYRDGAAWAVEIYRSRHDAVRRTVPFLMHHALQSFMDEGVEEASLCFIPAARCAPFTPCSPRGARSGSAPGVPWSAASAAFASAASARR